MKTNEPVAGMAERAGLNSDHTDDLENLRPVDSLRVTDYTENGVDSISEMRLRVRT